MSFLDHIVSPRLLALIRKELQQIMRDKRLLIVLVIPPTLQVLLFGFALSAQVSNLRLGVLDDSRTAESRELTAIMTQGRAFVLVNSYSSVDQLGAALMANRIDLGLVIPWDYTKRLYRRQPAVVQLLLNGVDVNTAQIAARVRRSHHRLAEPGAADRKGHCRSAGAYVWTASRRRFCLSTWAGQTAGRVALQPRP